MVVELVTRTKKKFLIIFFSIILSFITEAVVVIIILSAISNNKNKTIENYLSFIEKDNHLLYKYSDQSILYKDGIYRLEKLIDNNDVDVDYVSEKYLIFSTFESGHYYYYSINNNGEINYLFNTGEKDEESKYIFNTDYILQWKYYNNGKFYIVCKDAFYTYDVKQSSLSTISFDKYFLEKDDKYQIAQYDEKRLKITDVDSGFFKFFSLDDNQPNDTINKLKKVSDLKIYDYLIVGHNIYIVLYINTSYAVTIRYDFGTEDIYFVDKIESYYWDTHFRIFYLENQVCYPLETLIANS